MQLTIANPRAIKSLDQLSPIEQQQLVAAGREWDGLDLSAEERLLGDDEETMLYEPELCDLVDESGAVVFQAWTYSVDSGSIFRAGTLESVGGFIQNDLECDDDLHAPIAAAIKAARAAGLKASILLMRS